MSKKSFLVLVISIFIGLLLISGDNMDSQKIEDLQKSVIELEKRLKAVEAEFKELKKEFSDINIKQWIAIPQSKDLGKTPPSWELKEFNGILYFLIPLNME